MPSRASRFAKAEYPRAFEYPKAMVQPKYPAAALKAGIEGAVELRAVISSNGKTQKLTLVKGDPVFATPTVQAIRKWRFHAVLVNGKRVQTAYPLQVRFVPSLQEAVTDLKIESPPEDAPAAGELPADAESDTREGHV